MQLGEVFERFIQQAPISVLFRTLLEHALNHHRIFSVALVKPDRNEWESTADFFHVAGVGLIRAWVDQGAK